MQGITLNIENSSPELLEFLAKQKERKERIKQELAEVADLYFPELKNKQEECPHCSQNLQNQ